MRLLTRLYGIIIMYKLYVLVIVSTVMTLCFITSKYQISKQNWNDRKKLKSESNNKTHNTRMYIRTHTHTVGPPFHGLVRVYFYHWCCQNVGITNFGASFVNGLSFTMKAFSMYLTSKPWTAFTISRHHTGSSVTVSDLDS